MRTFSADRDRGVNTAKNGVVLSGHPRLLLGGYRGLPLLHATLPHERLSHLLLGPRSRTRIEHLRAQEVAARHGEGKGGATVGHSVPKSRHALKRVAATVIAASAPTRAVGRFVGGSMATTSSCRLSQLMPSAEAFKYRSFLSLQIIVLVAGALHSQGNRRRI